MFKYFYKIIYKWSHFILFLILWTDFYNLIINKRKLNQLTMKNSNINCWIGFYAHRDYKK